MTLKECRKYIESELKKETPKTKIEEYLKKNYREGLWKGLLTQYPERKDLNRNKMMNNVFFYYVLFAIIVQVIAFVFIILTYQGTWSRLATNIMIIIVGDSFILFLARKGLASVYSITILFFIISLLGGNLLNIIIHIPLAIMAYTLKKRLHPNYGFFGEKKKKIPTSEQQTQ